MTDPTRNGPPRWLDRLLRGLLPPLVREEVAGDLWERHRSTGQYLREAATTLPFLLYSQMRRATTGAMLLLEGFIVFASLGGFNPAERSATLPMAPRVAIVTLAALAALLLRDAYRTTNRWTLGRAGFDLIAVVFAIFGAQAIVAAIAPAWLMPPMWLYGGLVFALMMLFILRTGVDLVSPDAALSPGAALPAVLMQDYLRFRANVRFKNIVETVALSAIGAVAIWFDLRAPLTVAIIGMSWTAITFALLVLNWTRGQPRALPDGASLAEMLGLYRAELRRQRSTIRFVWWWYFVPLYAGLLMALVMPGLQSGNAALTLTGLCCFAALVFAIAGVNAARRRQLTQKLAVLDLLASAGTH